MAAIRTLKARTGLLKLLGEVRYTLSRARAFPLASSLVPSFQAIRDRWTLVQAREIACQEAISDAQALVDQADDDLDDFASKLSKVLLTITKDNEKDDLYVHFFLGKTLREHCKPILNKQLAIQTKWVSSLQGSPFQDLNALAPELIKLIQAANDAVAARSAAHQANKMFHDIGERAQFVDQLNAERKSSFGELGKISESTPGLPGDFPNRFYRVLEDDPEPTPTLASVTDKIKALSAELDVQKALLEKLDQEAKDAAVEAEKKQAKDTLKADLKARRDALTKQLEEMDEE